MSIRAFLATSICIAAMLLLAGCASYPNLTRSEAASKEAHSALIDVAAEIRNDPALTDEQRSAQQRYLHKLASVIYAAELNRALLSIEKMKSGEAISIDRSLAIVFTTLGAMAQLRGELGEDGQPATTETAEAFAQLRKLALPE